MNPDKLGMCAVINWVFAEDSDECTDESTDECADEYSDEFCSSHTDRYSVKSLF